MSGELDGLSEEELGADDRAALLSFLGITRTMTSPNLRAFLTLKQSKQELELPGYSDFEDALVTGNPELLEKVLGGTTDQQLEEYAAALIPLFRTQIPVYMPVARVIVETAAGSPTLRDRKPDAIASLVAVAVHTRDPFREELAMASPSALLGAEAALDDALIRDLMGLEISSITAAPTRVRPVLEALADLPAERFDETNIASLRSTLNAESLVSDFELYLPVVRKVGGAVPPGAGEKAMAELSSSSDLQARSKELETLQIWLKNTVEQEPIDAQLLGLIEQSVTTFLPTSPDAEQFVAFSDRLRPIIQVINARPTLQPEAVSLLGQLPTFVQNGVKLGVAETALDFAASVAALGNAAREAHAQALVAAATAIEATAALDYAMKRGASTPAVLKRAILQNLVALAREGGDQSRADAASTILVLDPGDRAGFLAAAVKACIEGHMFGAAREHLAAHPAELDPKRSEFAADALAQAVAAPNADTLVFALEMTAHLDDPGRTQLTEVLATFLEAPSVEGAGVLQAAKTATAFDSNYSTLVLMLWDKTRGVSPAPVGLLQLLRSEVAALDDAKMKAFTEQLREWLIEGTHRDQLLAVLASGPEFSASDQGKITEAVLAAELGLVSTDFPARATILRGAKQIPGSGKNARKSVSDRIDAIENGTPDDQEVYSQLVGE